MRKILIFAYVGIFFLISLPLLLILLTVGLFHKALQKKWTFYIAKYVCRSILFFLGAKVFVKGSELVPENGSLLFTGNHRSLLDIVLTVAHSPRPIAFIAKDSLGKVPVLSWWMSSLGCLFLDRESARNALATILTGIENMKQGQCYIIFPEGTRNMENQELLPFKKGSLKLAEKSDSLIVPFALRGTDEMFEQNNYQVKPGNLYLSFGESIDLKALTAEEMKANNEYVQNRVKILFDETLEA